MFYNLILFSVGKFENARKSIEWYRGGQQVEEVFEEVRKFVNDSKNLNFWTKIKMIREKAVSKATLLVVILMALQQLCGFNNVLFFMQSILEDAKVDVIEPSNIVNWVGLLGFLGSILSIFLIDRSGRKLLIIISSIGVMISMVGLGAHFNFLDQLKDHPGLQYLPIVSLFLFDVAFFLGLMSVPNTVMSEIFPNSVKSIASCIAALAGALAAFLVTLFFHKSVDYFGYSNLFYLNACAAIIVVPYALFFMPETKGKTFQQIQDKLLRK